MLRIAVCDDRESDIQRVAALLQEYRRLNPHKPFVLDPYTRPFALGESLSKGAAYDIFLLDIYMDGLTGMELAREIRRRKEPCSIIFLTNSPDYAVDAFSVDAVQYLLKPYTKTAFFAALDKALAACGAAEDQYIVVKTGEGVVRVPFGQIIYSASSNHMQCIFRCDGATVQTRMTVAALFGLFGGDGAFVRCGQAYIVNLRYVRSVTSQEIALESGVRLPMPRGHYRAFKNGYLEYMLNPGAGNS